MLRTNLKAWGLALGLASGLFAAQAGALPIGTTSNGTIVDSFDLIVVLAEGGDEYIINLGAADQSHTFDLTGNPLGTLSGITLVALAQEIPDASGDFASITYSSPSSNPTVDANRVFNSSLVVDSFGESTAWFWQLRADDGTPGQTAFYAAAASNSFSYASNLNLNTSDNLNGDMPFVIKFGLGATPIPVCTSSTPDQLTSNTSCLGELQLSGSTLVYSYVPEPGTVLLVGLGLLGLAAVERRTARS